MSQEQSFVLHKCECCHKTRKMHQDGKCFHCIIDHLGVSCFEEKGNTIRRTSQKYEELPTLEEVNRRIMNGEDTPEMWHLKRKIVARNNLYNVNATEGDSAYVSRSRA